MTDPSDDLRRSKLFSILEMALILVLASVPLFITFPYRVNIFLSWEGAWRISQGEIPYKDFGMPMGYMYWVIPAVFFKIFGAQLITLVKAQVFINILSGFAFRSILKHLNVQPAVRLLSVLLYCISFSFFNFWPWYNHTVIVYEVIGLAFLMKYMFSAAKWHWLSLSALFIFFSFFTKQDGGGMAFLLCLVILGYYCFHEKKWMPLLIFTGSFLIVAFAIIAPLLRYNFGYWFNHGQPPHTSRISVSDITEEFFSASQWIKFYLFLIVLIALANFRNIRALISQKRPMVFLLLTLGMLAEAAILQVTSYTPPDNNIFFHSFAIAFILSFLSLLLKIDFSRIRNLSFAALGLLLWWSSVYWKYFERITNRILPPPSNVSANGENLVNRHTYMLYPPSKEVPMNEWVFCGLHSFDKVYMPEPTAEGIRRLMERPEVRNHPNLRVLNMSELTPLEAEMPFKTDKGEDIPLWYHLGVAMFNKEAKMLEERIAKNQYDLVLFEYIPMLNNFYPFRVRDSLNIRYQKVDSFYAPRRGSETTGMVEVFVKK